MQFTNFSKNNNEDNQEKILITYLIFADLQYTMTDEVSNRENLCQLALCCNCNSRF